MTAALIVLVLVAGWEAIVRLGIVDELLLPAPTQVLDALTRLQMQRWLEGALAREPRTVLLVTHDVEEAVLLSDRVVLPLPSSP